MKKNKLGLELGARLTLPTVPTPLLHHWSFYSVAFHVFMFFRVFLCFTDSLCGCVFSVTFTDIFSYIAASLFTKLTYLVTYSRR